MTMNDDKQAKVLDNEEMDISEAISSTEQFASFNAQDAQKLANEATRERVTARLDNRPVRPFIPGTMGQSPLGQGGGGGIREAGVQEKKTNPNRLYPLMGKVGGSSVNPRIK